MDIETPIRSLIHFYPGKTSLSFGELEESGNGRRFRLHLNKDGTSWVDGFMMDPLPTVADFGALWALKPPTRGLIKIMGKEREVPRYQQTYGKGYWFSGMEHPPLPTPPILQRYLDSINTTAMYSDQTFNEALLNWYSDGTQYIGQHADSLTNMNLGPNGESVIFSMTFQEGSNRRIFRMKPKAKFGKTAEERKRLGKERVDIEMPNGLVLVMGGLCQETHTHQVPKTKKEGGRRINLTLRSFQ
uniref:Alkylated DNA repair dioxygenase n=1 Tax=Pithovirus LCPAC304 TaxID=2506594 RepID=A0A481Z7J0_9VIRU|nr:MAG: alkylated DNA repair dioxygenase [Pithovirus LCPAC304]